MKLAFLFAAIVSVASAQQLPKVDPPSAVDVNVSQVEWHPKGLALMYTKPDQKGGRDIGLYALGQKEGEVVLHLAEKDGLEVQWFEGQPLIAMVVYRKVVKDNVPSIEASIYLGDAMTGSTSKLWAETFPAKAGVGVNAYTSPSLRHAIFRIRSGQTQYHMVLAAGGNRMVYARDLDQAVQNGAHGPFWSVDGTAVYSPSQEIETNGNEVTLRLSEDLANMKVQAQKITVESTTISLSGLKFWISQPAPKAGAAVLELMPANAVLRQVRFRGGWESVDNKLEPLTLVTRPQEMHLGSGSYIANSLWLVREKDKANGILLAAHSDTAWMAPRYTGIAYTTDGALFVRAFPGNR